MPSNQYPSETSEPEGLRRGDQASAQELAAPRAKIKEGYAYRYSKMVSSGARGAVFKEEF